MNFFQKRIHLWLFCLCIVACAVPALSIAAENANAAESVNAELYSALKGRWEGALSGAFRSQEVSWHFDVDSDGELKGYMGPSLAGMPRLPMKNLAVTDERVSFSLDAQHATFTGTFSPAGISGSWQQGTTLPLQMTKKNFVFPLSDAVRAALVGRWDMDNRGAEIQLEFSEGEGSTLSGYLSIPSSDLHDIPLVDIFVTDAGYAQFATDNGRRFTGRLINGVLLGEYVSGGTTYKRTFVRDGQRGRGFDLALSEETRQRMLGRWNFKVRGDDSVLEVTTSDAGTTRAQLLFSEGPLRTDPLLELNVLDDATVSFTTFGGRTFKGSFEDGSIAGEYRVNVFPFRVTFTR